MTTYIFKAYKLKGGEEVDKKIKGRTLSQARRGAEKVYKPKDGWCIRFLGIDGVLNCKED